MLLNLTPDHLDRHGTLEAYTAAKLEIFARQGNDDVAVAPARELASGEDRRGLGRPGRLSAPGAGRRAVRARRRAVVAGQPLLALEELRLRGRHNVENAMAAAAVCLARGIERDAVRAGLRSFAGWRTAWRRSRRRDGVLYVNDSKATNVASTLVALDAFAPGPIHLILGGQGKGQDFTALRGPVARAAGRCI